MAEDSVIRYAWTEDGWNLKHETFCTVPALQFHPVVLPPVQECANPRDCHGRSVAHSLNSETAERQTGS